MTQAVQLVGGSFKTFDYADSLLSSSQIGQAPSALGLIGRGLRYAVPTNNAAGLHVLGCLVTQNGTTTTTGALSSADLRQASVRNQSTTSAANTLTGPTVDQASVFRGSLTGVGGFFCSWRLAYPSVQTDSKLFIGLLATGLAGSGNPSANANCVGFGADSGDTNVTLLSVNSGGSSTKTAIGGGFTKASLATGDPNTSLTRVIEWALYAAPNDSKVTATIWDWSNNVEILAPTDITATLPTNTQVLRPWSTLASTGATANTSALFHFYAYY